MKHSHWNVKQLMLERTNIPVAFQLQAMEGTVTHMFNVFSEKFAALKLI